MNSILLSITILISSISFGQKNESKFNCVDSLNQIGNILAFGHFINDVGCRYTNLKIDGQWLDYDKGMIFLAKRAVQNKMLDKMLLIVDKLYLKTGVIMYDSDDALVKSKYDFSKPEIKSKDEKIFISAWVKGNGYGDSQEIKYKYAKFIINDSGNIMLSEKSSFLWHIHNKQIIDLNK